MKDVSIGEFDVHSALTHITHQRGRLMFHMGVQSITKMATNDATMNEQSLETNTTSRPNIYAHRTYRSGPYSGRSLYPEEVYFLLQRGALIVYELAEVTEEHHNTYRVPISIDQFVAMVRMSSQTTIAMLDVYTCLKENKLHPRRYISQDHAEDNSKMFEVFKSITETVYLDIDHSIASKMTDQDEQTKPGDTAFTICNNNNPSLKRRIKRKTRQHCLLFRVLVCHYEDPIPNFRLLQAAMRTPSNQCVPLKLGVVQSDHTVLMFEIGA